MKTSVGERLKQKRKAQRLTQDQLAERLGVTRQTISKWENNKTVPEINSLLLFCDLFETTLDELLRDVVSDQKGMDRMKKKMTQQKRMIGTLAGTLICLGGLFTYQMHQATRQITDLQEKLPDPKVTFDVYDSKGKKLLSEGIYDLEDPLDKQAVTNKTQAIIEKKLSNR